MKSSNERCGARQQDVGIFDAAGSNKICPIHYLYIQPQNAEVFYSMEFHAHAGCVCVCVGGWVCSLIDIVNVYLGSSSASMDMTTNLHTKRGERESTGENRNLR